MGKVTIAGILCALVVTGASRAIAGVCSIEVSPVTLELRIDPGRAYTGSVQVRNAGEEPQHIRAYCQDWTLKPDGVVIFAPAQQLPQSASGWVTLALAEFDLAPGASEAVRYTIRAPADAAGETRTVIVFEAGAQRVTLRGTPSRVIPRLGTTVYVQSGPAPPAQARVAQFDLTPKGGWLAVENDGGAHLRFTGQTEVRRDGQLMRAGSLPGFVVLPPPFNRRQVALPQDLLAGLGPGEYEVTAILDCGAPSLLGARTSLVVSAGG